jgi:hypothetical protein
MTDITAKLNNIKNMLDDISKCMNDNIDNIYITQVLFNKKKLLEDSLDKIISECEIDYNQIHFYKLHIERDKLLKTPDIKDFNNKLIEINQKLTQAYDYMRNKTTIFDNINSKKI